MVILIIILVACWVASLMGWLELKVNSRRRRQEARDFVRFIRYSKQRAALNKMSSRVKFLINNEPTTPELVDRGRRALKGFRVMQNQCKKHMNEIYLDMIKNGWG
jgi:hypothetical protein